MPPPMTSDETITVCSIAATNTTATRERGGRDLRSPATLRGDEDEHGVERPEVDVRVDLHLLEQVGVGLADARHLADRDPLRDRAS